MIMASLGVCPVIGTINEWILSYDNNSKTSGITVRLLFLSKQYSPWIVTVPSGCISAYRVALFTASCLQMGLNGVDNGRIWFDRVRVPRKALLNKFADVSPDGQYTTSIPTVSSRFGVHVLSVS